MYVTKPIYNILKFKVKKKFPINSLNPFVFCFPTKIFADVCVYCMISCEHLQ